MNAAAMLRSSKVDMAGGSYHVTSENRRLRPTRGTVQDQGAQARGVKACAKRGGDSTSCPNVGRKLDAWKGGDAPRSTAKCSRARVSSPDQNALAAARARA